MGKYILIWASLFSVLLSSCDEGRIPEKDIVSTEEGRVAKLSCNITGLSAWPSGYNVVVAGFNESSPYAITAMNISSVSVKEGEDVDLVLSGISDEVTTIELCVINRLRKRIVSFSSTEALDTSDTIRIDVGALDVSMYNAIQQSVFTPSCAACHGSAAGTPSGNLYLTEGNSYASLYDVNSTKVDNLKRVSPGSAGESVLYQVLTTNLSADWHYDHSLLLDDSDDLVTLIEDWIDSGARP